MNLVEPKNYNNAKLNPNLEYFHTKNWFIFANYLNFIFFYLHYKVINAFLQNKLRKAYNITYNIDTRKDVEISTSVALYSNHTKHSFSIITGHTL